MKVFEVGKRVMLSKEGFYGTQDNLHPKGKRSDWMRDAVGTVIDHPVPNENWVAVRWDGREDIWTEHKSNITIA